MAQVICIERRRKKELKSAHWRLLVDCPSLPCLNTVFRIRSPPCSLTFVLHKSTFLEFDSGGKKMTSGKTPPPLRPVR